MGKDLVYVMDMESSLAEALVRRVIDMNPHVIFRRWDMEVDPRAEVNAYRKALKALIISGSARNIRNKKKPVPRIPAELFELDVPILAICYGMQYLAHLQGTPIIRCWDEVDPKKRNRASAKKDKGEHGPTVFSRTGQSNLFVGLGEKFPVWMKHNWMLQSVPDGWTHTGMTDKCPVAAMERGNIYAVQFHPEPYNSLFGKTILYNFFSYICEIDTPYF